MSPSGNGGSSNGGTFKALSNTAWTKTGTTWNSQPAIDGATLGSVGAVVASTWYEVDVTAVVTGNGTYSHYGFGTIQANSEARNSTAYGVLKFTLHANTYDWQFVPVAGQTYNDSGTGSCH